MADTGNPFLDAYRARKQQLYEQGVTSQQMEERRREFNRTSDRADQDSNNNLNHQLFMERQARTQQEQAQQQLDAAAVGRQEVSNRNNIDLLGSGKVDIATSDNPNALKVGDQYVIPKNRAQLVQQGQQESIDAERAKHTQWMSNQKEIAQIAFPNDPDSQGKMIGLGPQFFHQQTAEQGLVRAIESMQAPGGGPLSPEAKAHALTQILKMKQQNTSDPATQEYHRAMAADVNERTNTRKGEDEGRGVLDQVTAVVNTKMPKATEVERFRAVQNLIDLGVQNGKWSRSAAGHAQQYFNKEKAAPKVLENIFEKYGMKPPQQ